MNKCPRCASNLTFDIKAQMFACERCGTLIGPGRMELDTEQEMEEYFEAAVYSCEQCGGEMVCDNTMTVPFCSYCGSSAVTGGRMGKRMRPKHIIPFQKTKEDYQKAYKEMVKGAFFAPDAYKDESQLERVRAVYVSYWVYDMSANQKIEFEGIKNTQRGEYRVTHHIGFETRLQTRFQGLTIEASLAFPDRLNTLIEPFRLSEKKSFLPAYLRGFYADTNDVEIRDYEKIAQNVAVGECYKEFGELYPRYEFEDDVATTSLKEALSVHDVNGELALFPVWLWSYRKKDKVAYALMNGQTGKMAVELPIDLKKFLGIASLVSLPFILLFNFLFVMEARTLLSMLGFLVLFLGILISEKIIQTLEHSFHEDFLTLIPKKESERKKRYRWAKWMLLLGGFAISIVQDFCQGLMKAEFRQKNMFLYIDLTDYLPRFEISKVFALTAICTFVIAGIKLKKSYRYDEVSIFHEEAYQKEWNQKLLYLIKPVLTVLMVMIVLFINPLSNIAYHAALIGGMGMLLWSILDLVKLRNETQLHPLPEFENTGGEER